MNNLLIKAVAASVEAGKAIMQIYDNKIEVDYKADDSPLTAADTAANAIIVEALLETNIPIISEETKQLPFSERADWSQCWMVDPLDGTKEFIKRNGEFTVNIALIENGKPVLGVIYVPATQVLYVGDVKNNEALHTHIADENTNDYTSLLQNAKSLNPQQDKNTLRIVGSRSHMSAETEAFVEQCKSTGKEIEIVAKGSSLKLCLIAEGSADVYPRLAPTMEWDTAAGHAICNAVGLQVLNWETKEELSYNKENLLNPFFVVSNTEGLL